MISKNTIFNICVVLLGLQKVEAQKVVLSGAAMFLPLESFIVGGDYGIEIRINSDWSTKLSVAGIGISALEGASRDRAVLSLEGRYFFKNERWLNSFFAGPIIQFHNRNSYLDLYDKRYVGYEYKESNKFGFGIIGGKRIHIYKRIGCEFHGGLVTEMGNRITNLNYEPSYKPKEMIIEKNHIGIRPFWGFNFYLALGKMKPEYMKRNAKNNKNTEGGTL